VARLSWKELVLEEGWLSGMEWDSALGMRSGLEMPKVSVTALSVEERAVESELE
jgi:hypothetical protein